MSSAPVLEEGVLQPRPMVLRGFIAAQGERYAVMGKNDEGVIEFAFGGALSAALVRYEQKINKLNVTPDDTIRLVETLAPMLAEARQ